MGSTPPSHSVEEALLPLRKALAALMRAPALTHGDVDAMLRQLTEVAASLLRVERASVWRLDEEKSRITCADLFERGSGKHTRGAEIARADAERYFAALAEERTLTAHDARDDPRTSDFTAGYLVPNGITSMLDAPIFSGGGMVGVVCHEHVGPKRQWKLWEELVAGTIADFVSLALGSAQRITAERELDAHRKHLEDLVLVRTERLRESESGLRTLFEASPISLVLSQRDTQEIILTNERAADMFGLAGQAGGKLATDFWVDPDDRHALTEAVRATGRVEGLEARLKTSTGREFWAQLAGQLMTFEGTPALLIGVHDVTLQHLAEAALRKQGETLQALFEAAPVPLLLTGLDDGLIRSCNRRAVEMFDLPFDVIVGKSAADLYVDASERAEFLHRLKSVGHVASLAVKLKTGTDRPFWALMSAQLFELEGEQVFMVGFSDMTRQKEIEEQLRELATKDALTGLCNRRHFFDLAEADIARTERYGRPLSLALIDLDHFKAVNDTHGHETGDDVLRLFAQTCSNELRQTDVLARYGGEEFVIMMPETECAAGFYVIERVRRAVERLRYATATGEYSFTISAGLVERAPGETLASMLRRADDQMYAAKGAGRNRLSSERV